jgi:PAS domain S-box-containing protein
MEALPVFLFYVSIMTSVAVGIYAFSHRHIAGAFQYGIVALAYAVTTLVYGLEITAVGLTAKYLADSIQWLTWSVSSGALVMFALRYTNVAMPRAWRGWLGLLAFPVVFQVLDLTNDLHGLTRANVQIVAGVPYSALTYEYAAFSWVMIVYLLIVLPWAGIILLFRHYRRTRGVRRSQTTILLLASSIPFVATGLFAANVTLFGQRDYMPLAYAISNLIVAWGLFRYGLFDLLPLARDMVIDNLPDGIIILDAQDRIVDINNAARHRLHQGKEKLLGKPIRDAFAQYSGFLDVLTNVSQTRQEFKAANDSEKRFFEIETAPITRADGLSMGRVVTLRDITLHKATEAALKHARDEALNAHRIAIASSQMKSQFLATMSHELRTPLNAVIGYAQLQLAGMVGDMTAEQYEFQERILVNAQHLLQLINEVLDLSKIEAGRMELTLARFDLRACFEEILQQNQVLAQNKGLMLRMSIDDKLPEVILGDRGRIKQIVINLVSNAIKFTDRGGVALDVTLHDERSWRITVKDTGIGIPAHLQEIIFDEFRQVENGTERGGTGLGLAIVRKLVLMMGGTIRLSSEVKMGSIFSVTLPLHDGVELKQNHNRPLWQEVNPL